MEEATRAASYTRRIGLLKRIGRALNRFSRWLGGSSAPFMRSPIQVPMVLDEVERATEEEAERKGAHETDKALLG
jgi:hypothetical protein